MELPSKMNRPDSCKSCDQKTLQDPSSELCDRCQLASELTSIMPPEIWTAIFNYLDVAGLLRVRSTCRRWKCIVDGSPSLRKRIVARLSGQIDSGFNPESIPGVNLSIAFSDVVTVDAWWPAVGQRLDFLELYDCRIAKSTFWEMLRQTKVLKTFRLHNVSYLDTSTTMETGADFQMTNLEYLVLETYGDDSQVMFLTSVLETFSDICPRLVYLGVVGYDEEKPVIKMIKGVEATLQWLRIDATGNILAAMANMKKLQLVDLQIELNEEHTLNIGHMPNLENLDVTASNSNVPTLNFGSFWTPNVQELHLEGYTFTGNSLVNFLLNCPRLRKISTERVIIDETVNFGTNRFQQFNALRTLKIHQSTVSCLFLLDLFGLCANLEQLHLSEISEVTDDLILQASQKLKRLKRLFLECWTTDAAVYHIINNHGSELRELSIWPVNRDAKQKLLEHFRPLGCTVIFLIQSS